MAGANTKVWTDIYMSNSDMLAEALDETIRELSGVRDALDAEDSGALAAWNERAREARERLAGDASNPHRGDVGGEAAGPPKPASGSGGRAKRPPLRARRVTGVMDARFEPSRGLHGEYTAPPDKSISHRAALLGAMASEPTRIENYLHAADTDSTLAAVRALGALVDERDGVITVRGTGLREAREPRDR